MLNLFLPVTFNFNRPGYQLNCRTEPEDRALEHPLCPVNEDCRNQGDEAVDVLRYPRYILNFALAQEMTAGGTDERDHTHSAGDPISDMPWSGRPRHEPGTPTVRNTRVPAFHLAVR